MSPALRTFVRGRRGAGSVVEVLVIVGIVLTCGLFAVQTLGRGIDAAAVKEADCIDNGGCNMSSGGNSAASNGGLAALGGGGGPGGGSTNGAGGTSLGFAIAKFVDGMIEGAFMGDFVDKPGVPQVVGQILMGFVPYAGQAADVRDLIAAGIHVYQGKDGAWWDLLFNGIAIVPGVGDAVKGLRTLSRTGAEIAQAGHAGERIAETTRRAREAACPGGICTVPGQCFAAGTPVATASGAKPIETIVVGDVVLARDPETGETSFRRVAETFVRHAEPTVDLELEDDRGVHDDLVVTREHPFFVIGRGFTTVGDLVPGEHVKTATGEARVVSLRSLPNRVDVFNFEVEHDHTYFVGGVGAWVHNACGRGVLEGALGGAGKSAAELAEMAERVRRMPIDLDATAIVRRHLGEGSARDLLTSGYKKEMIERVEAAIKNGQPVDPALERWVRHETLEHILMNGPLHTNGGPGGLPYKDYTGKIPGHPAHDKAMELLGDSSSLDFFPKDVIEKYGIEEVAGGGITIKYPNGRP